jgi:hypothetical protein
MCNCLNCSARSPMVTELLRILEDGDPIRAMEILMELKDVGTTCGILDDHDRSELTRLNYLLGAVVRESQA